ncbi:hypothetical protein UY3_06191 [Chelonia mydas]|uniref:Uncharacterized protein n=1 Tax=Chelonia mydas TaxID=8469 RepID=M7BLK6_CHEMY|nr:hypothetical protein UY3_06191 [Chelonia mydas]
MGLGQRTAASGSCDRPNLQTLQSLLHATKQLIGRCGEGALRQATKQLIGGTQL